MLVAELGIQQRSAHKGAVERGLVPAHMQMINVHMTKTPHHLHLILNCEAKEREREIIIYEYYK